MAPRVVSTNTFDVAEEEIAKRPSKDRDGCRHRDDERGAVLVYCDQTRDRLPR